MLSLIEGSAGAILMALFGLLAIVGFPLAVALSIIQAVLGKERPSSWYAFVFGAPCVSMALAIGVFVVRSLLNSFYQG